MMTTDKTIFCGLLAALLLCTSCSDSSSIVSADAVTDPVSGQTAGTVTAETKDPFYETDLPVRDLGGAEFMIAYNNCPNIHGSVIPDEETGDVLNDTQFRRNMTIEETYNVSLVQYDYNDTESTVRNAVTAGEDAYDLIMLRCPQALTWWKEGLLIPFDALPNLNLEKGYWDQNINDALSIGGVQYIAEGAFNLDIYDLTFCLLFNKTLAAQFDLDDHYAAVKNGTWTYEQMLAQMQAVSADINGDGKQDEADRWGYTSHPKMVAPGFWIGGGVTSITKDADDIPYISMTEERFISAFDAYMALAHDSNAAYLTEGDKLDIPTECRTVFEEDRALFIDMSFFFIESMRGMDTDFGIIPYPKYDEAQENYHTRVCYYFPVVVPSTNADTDMTGYLLEILNYRSYHDVIPAYYDISLKTKGARDEASAQMLDLIFSSRVIDIGDSTLCDVIRDNFMFQMMKTDKRDLVSTVERNRKTIEKRLDTLIQ